MNSPENLESQIRDKTEEDLLSMLRKPDDWVPEAINAARAELRLRKIDISRIGEAEPRVRSSSNTSEEILIELRRMRRSSEIACCFAVAMVLIAGVYVFWRTKQIGERSSVINRLEQARQSYTSSKAVRSKPWDDVRDALDQFEYPKAVVLLRGIITQQPSYYYGYAYLGDTYLAMGDITNAETQYVRAYELFPDEANEKNLTAIRKRLTRERGSK
jgi:cytochrome c-type biogenesis protein CcmH/NrfG